MLAREAGRLETSLPGGGGQGEALLPPLPAPVPGLRVPGLLRLLQRYRVRACYYGHLHGAAQKRALEGVHYGTDFHLVAGDWLDFVPKKICE